MEFLKNGSEYISGLIADAVKNGHRTVTVTGNYEIDSSVRLPSDFELVLEDCHLRMADGVYDNMFVNEHHGTSVGRTVAGTDRNIRITGKGWLYSTAVIITACLRKIILQTDCLLYGRITSFCLPTLTALQ